MGAHSLTCPHGLKTCTYCGLANKDDVTVCAQCGTEFGQAAPVDKTPTVPFYRDPIARFRMLVVLSVICSVLLLIGPWVFWRDLSDETSDGLSWRGFGAVLPIATTVYYITNALWLLAAVGVYFFVPGALWLYTALVVFGMATTLLGGMQTGLAAESFLFYLLNLGDGAILALAYWTPLRDEFAKRGEEPVREEE
jgi:hypothetical protein